MASSQPRCLICEDQALIGLALEGFLEEAGLGIVGPFTSSQAALAWAETDTPELAVLDYKLKDGPCTRLAQMLLQRGVHVVIYSGWRRQGANLPLAFADLPWLEKPCDRAALMSALTSAAPPLTSQAHA